jgi:hypothetical protein
MQANALDEPPATTSACAGRRSGIAARAPDTSATCPSRGERSTVRLRAGPAESPYQPSRPFQRNASCERAADMLTHGSRQTPAVEAHYARHEPLAHERHREH